MSQATLDTASPSTDAPARAEERWAWLRSEPVVLAAMLLALGVYYLVPGLLSAAVGGLAFLALSIYRPNLQLAMVPLAIPLFYRPRNLGNLYFSLAEFIVVCGIIAWALRDGWTLAQIRRVPSVRAWVRQPSVWLAFALGTIGALWLLVPEAAYRKLAMYEFWRTVLIPLLFFGLMLRWLRTGRDLWRMVGAWLIAAALVGREGFEQYLYGQTAQMEGVGRVVSVYPSATALGIYLGRGLALGLALAVFLPKKWRNWRIAAALLSVMIGLGVLFSFARGAWIGVFLALLCVALISRSRSLLIGLGGAAVVGMAAIAVAAIRGVQRIRSMFDLGSEQNTGLARTELWAAALRMLRDRPLTGIGQDQFLYQDPKYELQQTRLLVASHPHNFVFDFWLRLGLPGLLWVMAALGYFFWEGVRLWRRYRGTEWGALVLALIASMVTFVVHGLLDMAYFTMDLALTFWLTMGLLVILRVRNLPPASEE